MFVRGHFRELRTLRRIRGLGSAVLWKFGAGTRHAYLRARCRLVLRERHLLGDAVSTSRWRLDRLSKAVRPRLNLTFAPSRWPACMRPWVVATPSDPLFLPYDTARALGVHERRRVGSC